MTNTLLVPMAVDALVVGLQSSRSELRLLEPMADFSALPTGEEIGSNRRPYDSSQIGRRAPPFGGEVPARAGVHLHWALPKAFMHGVKNKAADGAEAWTNIPTPNRWLVSRLVVDATNKKIASRHFVVESDRLSVDSKNPCGLQHPTVPVAAGRRAGEAAAAYRCIGGRFDLDGWKEDPSAERFENLTAVGYGSVTFSSYYPNCSTVFGFFDAGEDLEKLRGAHPDLQIIYHVAGWYSKNDPMATPKLKALLAEFWDNTGGAERTRTLAHGATPRITWRPDLQAERMSGPDMRFSFATSESSALSALLADWAKIKDLEPFCDGLQNGLLQDGTDSVDALARFRRSHQAAGFTTTASGREWIVTPKTAPEPELKEPAALPKALHPALLELNRLEDGVAAKEGLLSSKRQDAYSDWSRYQTVLYGDAPIPFDPNWVNRIRTSILASVAEIEELERKLQQERSAIDAKVKEIKEKLPSDLELSAVARGGWSAPVNPIVMMAGKAARHFDRWGVDRLDPRKLLPCRVADDILGGLQLRIGGAAPGAVTPPPGLHGNGLASLPESCAGMPLRSLVERLLHETILLDGEFVATFSVLPRGFEKRAYDAAISRLLAPAPSAAPAAGGAPGDSVTPSSGRPPTRLGDRNYSHEPPFMPIFGQYEVIYLPEYEQRLEPDYLLQWSSWTDDDDLQLTQSDMDLRSAALAEAASEAPYRGLGVLAEASLSPLLEAAERVGRLRPETNLRAAFTPLERLQPLVMELSGFNRSMISLNSAPQMKVTDPYASAHRQPEVDAVARAIGMEGVFSPQARSFFSPVRAGVASLRRVRILDVFGRFHDEYPKEVIYASAIRAQGFGADSTSGARLRPRLLHPARLDFRWLNAMAARGVEESTCHPDSSPVFGWLLVNRMDRGVAVFNPDGSRLATLCVRDVGSSVELRLIPPPGPRAEPANAHLRSFLDDMLRSRNPAVLENFLEKLSHSLQTVQPAATGEGGNLGLLVGRPLALVRAKIRFETRGLPPESQSWSKYGSDDSASLREDGGVSELKTPIEFGDSKEYDDGLALFWQENDGELEYSLPMSPQDQNSMRLNMNQKSMSVKINADESTYFSFLIDPRSPFHVRCGLLPSLKVQIPDYYYLAAYRRLDVVFQAGPVLVSEKERERFIPAPRAVKGEWRWWAPDGQECALSQDVEAKLPTPREVILSDGWLRFSKKNDMRDTGAKK